MAEVMSMLPDENTSGELNADEQESLAVGEQMEQANNKLLAGKYSSTEDLEAAYVNLQKKLGVSDETVEPEEYVEPAEESEEPTENFLDTLWQESTSEWTQETVQQLENMSGREVADLYLNYRNQIEQSAPQSLTDVDISGLKNIVGGEANYQNMISWAGQNLPEADIDMYDQVMESGNPQAAYFAVQALAYRYQDSVGTEGQMYTGRSAANVDNTFRSQAELVEAMSDPRYDKDPAYRSAVMQKLEASDVGF